MHKMFLILLVGLVASSVQGQEVKPVVELPRIHLHRETATFNEVPAASQVVNTDKLVAGWEPTLTDGERMFVLSACKTHPIEGGLTWEQWKHEMSLAGVMYRDDVVTTPISKTFSVGIQIVDDGSRVSDQPIHLLSTARPVQTMRWLAANPDKKVIIIGDRSVHLFQIEWLKVIGEKRVVGIIFGHELNSKIKVSKEYAQEVIEARDYLRHFTSAKMILGVSRNLDPVKPEWKRKTISDVLAWVQAFGDDLKNWDAFAIHGVNSFAFFRDRTRLEILKEIGIPIDKPVYIYNFAAGATEREDRLVESWLHNFPPFIDQLKKEGWAGLFLEASPVGVRRQKTAKGFVEPATVDDILRRMNAELTSLHLE